MERRRFLGAVATVIGATAGCVSPNDTTMTEDEAIQQFDDVTEFETPSVNYGDATRFVDEEAGVVLYAVHGRRANAGAGLTSVPIEETDL